MVTWIVGGYFFISFFFNTLISDFHREKNTKQMNKLSLKRMQPFVLFCVFLSQSDCLGETKGWVPSSCRVRRNAAREKDPSGFWGDLQGFWETSPFLINCLHTLVLFMLQLCLLMHWLSCLTHCLISTYHMWVCGDVAADGYRCSSKSFLQCLSLFTVWRKGLWRNPKSQRFQRLCRLLME